MDANEMDNLFENTIIYRERFIAITTINKYEISETHFRAKGTIDHIIKRHNPRFNRPKLHTWSFGVHWNIVMGKFSQSIAAPYAGWTIWTDPGLVKYIEQLAKDGEDEEALKVLYDYECSP